MSPLGFGALLVAGVAFGWCVVRGLAWLLALPERRDRARRRAELLERIEHLPDGSVYVRLHTRPPLRAVPPNARRFTWKGDSTSTTWADMPPITWEDRP